MGDDSKSHSTECIFAGVPYYTIVDVDDGDHHNDAIDDDVDEEEGEADYDDDY